MRTSEERVAELHRRMGALKQAKAMRRYRLTCAAACAAALILTVLAALDVSRLPVWPDGAASGSVSASIFAGNTALGYVAVALAALCLGALVTVFCFRMKQRMNRTEKHDD